MRTTLTMGHARRPGADTEASRDLDAGKKLSRNPRLSDQHQAVSHRPQNGMRSFQVSSRCPALTRACKQRRRSCKRAITSHLHLQHQLLLGALLPFSLSLSLGCMRKLSLAEVQAPQVSASLAARLFAAVLTLLHRKLRCQLISRLGLRLPTAFREDKGAHLQAVQKNMRQLTLTAAPPFCSFSALGFASAHHAASR